ncbi:hypothetical protein [Geothrix sp. 21YS21S-4]|uniref:hypothetical protein n=1 Tax=Geothrix sp. 21YS21S-4 TaxID=3068889 RepID=UPI0027BADE55|nr:hypothetical protein [Geothrix sp. 21YS21S-4]
MSRIAPLLLLSLSLACVLKDRAALQRRPIGPALVSGWACLPLDADAQRQMEGAWIGDAAGRSVPFVEVREGLWESRSLPLDHLLTGRDTEGRPTAEFGLKLPESWAVGERESLRLDLDLEGQAPWVAQLQVERQREGGAFVAFEPSTLPYLYDLPPSGSQRSLDLPWDSHRYRLTLLASQGEAPRIRGLTVHAQTRPEALETELSLDGILASDPDRPHTWRLRLPEAQHVVGLDLLLAPPAAPLAPEIRLSEAEGDEANTPTRPCGSGDLVWNLPALGSRATRIALTPTMAKAIAFTLPEGSMPLSARVLVRRQTLLFPVEAGQTYALHLGGMAKPAPGSLGALPSPRALAATTPLALGAAEVDDQGLHRPVHANQQIRVWMPWVAILALLGLSYTAWRLMAPSASVAPAPPPPE